MRVGFLIGLQLFIFLHPVYCQLDSMTSVEIPIKYNEYPFYVLPAGKSGLLLYRPKYEDHVDDYNHFEFFFYDQNLKLSWISLLDLEYMFDVIEHVHSKDYLYIMFSGAKSFKKRLIIHRINLLTQEKETFEIETFFPEIISYFEIFKNTLVIGGREKSKPSIVFYPMDDMRPVILPGFYEKDILIYDIKIDEENELFTVLTGYSGKNYQGSLMIRSFDEFGQSVEDIRLEPDKNLMFVHAKSIIANHSFRLVTGIYKSKDSFYPTGIFLSSLQLDGTRQMRYDPFEDLYEGMDSVNRKRQDEQDRDVTPSMVNPERFHWHLTELHEFWDENVAVLESFSSDKGSSSFMDKSLIYSFQQALLISFTDQLIIQGISQFDLLQIQSDQLISNLKVRFDSDRLKLSLFDGNQILGKDITPDFKEGPVRLFTLDTGHTNNQANAEEDPVLNFLPWYEDYYLLLQMRSVKDREIQEEFIVRKMYEH